MSQPTPCQSWEEVCLGHIFVPIHHLEHLTGLYVAQANSGKAMGLQPMTAGVASPLPSPTSLGFWGVCRAQSGARGSQASQPLVLTSLAPALSTRGPNGLLFREVFKMQAAGNSIPTPTPHPKGDPEFPAQRPSLQERVREMENDIFIL